MHGSSVRTLEGNLAGARAEQLEKQRAARVEAVSREREAIAKSGEVPELKEFAARFRAQRSEKSATGVYGLKTREEFRAAQEDAAKRKDMAGINELPAEESEEASARKRRKAEKKRLRREKETKKSRALLSFGDEEDEQAAEEVAASSAPSMKALEPAADPSRGVVIGGEALGPGGPSSPMAKTPGCVASGDLAATRIVKNPDVDTAFLPDHERDAAREREVQRLKREWVEEQNRIKQEPIEVVFSFWDGSGHRRKVTVSKGTSVEVFLEKVRGALVKEFPHLRSATADTLMLIKEDMIVPHDATFYDLIASRARGKTGPLFSFSVQDDVRLVNDVRVQTDHTHAAKVCERHWYERNKHIYPASRWELLDLAGVFAELAGSGTAAT